MGGGLSIDKKYILVERRRTITWRNRKCV
jgi:hypothetical protein